MMLIFADRGIQSGWSADSIQSTLEGIEEKFEKCNDKLASVSVGPCSYQFQADKIEKMTQDLQTLQRYAGSPQIAWMLGAATGCIVSTAGMNLVFRNPKTGVVRECSLEEITSLEKLDASEINIAKLGKEVPTDDLELYMRYQKEGSIEHFTDSEKKTISRIETMGITGDECEEILRARGREVNRPPIEEPEVVLPPRNETSYGKSSGKYDTTADFLTNIENRNGKFYTDKATIDKIGQVEARGEDFSLLNKRIMSSRASTEGGTSVVYKYSDELGTKYLIHEVTDARGYIIHRDFDAVRISSGQLINKGH